MGFFSSALSTESSFGARPLGGLPANRDFEVYREPTAMSEWNEAIEADAAVGALPPGGLPLAWHFDVKNISFEGRQGTQGSEAWSEACSDGVHMQQPSQCVRVPAAQFEVTNQPPFLYGPPKRQLDDDVTVAREDWLAFDPVDTIDITTFDAFDPTLQRARLPKKHECKLNDAMLRDLRNQAGDCVLLRWDSFTIE